MQCVVFVGGVCAVFVGGVCAVCSVSRWCMYSVLSL